MSKWSNIPAIFAAASIAMAPIAAHADSLSKGKKAYYREDWPEAKRLFLKSKKPEASYLLVRMKMDGHFDECDVNCAITHLLSAGDRGYIPAITLAGELLYQGNQPDLALQFLQLAARWNDVRAGEILSRHGEQVPAPDLWNAHQAKLRADAEAERQQKLVAQQQWQQILGAAIGVGALYYGAKAQAQANGWSSPQSYDDVGSRSRPSYQPVIPSYDTTANTSRPVEQRSVIMCPDGKYVYGDHCTIAPDGTYHGGQTQLAPNGSYVVTQPHIAPDGTYVGGNGEIKICPDGSYVAGNYCHLAPDGSYVGAP